MSVELVSVCIFDCEYIVGVGVDECDSLMVVVCLFDVCMCEIRGSNCMVVVDCVVVLVVLNLVYELQLLCDENVCQVVVLQQILVDLNWCLDCVIDGILQKKGMEGIKVYLFFLCWKCFNFFCFFFVYLNWYGLLLMNGLFRFCVLVIMVMCFLWYLMVCVNICFVF